MLVPAHVGITLGVVGLVSWMRGQKLPSSRVLVFYSFLAIAPDLIDKTLHLIYSHYPPHGLFHSFFILGAVLTLVYFLNRKWVSPILVLLLHPVLDLVGTAPGTLIYPLTGWTDRVHFHSPVGKRFMAKLPWYFELTTLRGHYLIFEIAGLILLSGVIILKVLEKRKLKSTSQSSSLHPQG